MDEIPINADTINKSLDLLSDSTKESRKEVDKITAKGFNKLAQLLWSTPIGIKADVYIQERPYKLKKALEEMKRKYEEIPKENRTEPTSYIALKGINELNYSLDESHLKEMFQNLLISDMDSRKQNKVLPAYIEIIKQLSKDNAAFLKLLYNYDSNIPSILLKVQTKDIEGYNDLDSYIIYNYHKDENKNTRFSTLKLNKLVIDTLLMHRLIENTYDSYYPNTEEQYSTLFQSVSHNYKLEDNMLLTYDRGFVRLTELGKNFIDICLS